MLKSLRSQILNSIYEPLDAFEETMDSELFNLRRRLSHDVEQLLRKLAVAGADERRSRRRRRNEAPVVRLPNACLEATSPRQIAIPVTTISARDRSPARRTFVTLPPAASPLKPLPSAQAKDPKRSLSERSVD